MSSAFWSELAKLDDSLLTIQSQVDWMRAGFEFDDDLLTRSVTEARQHGASMRDLVHVERADAKWSDRESLERLIHELEIAAQERRNQQRRIKLLDLANELDAGTIKHRLEARATALAKLRQEAIKQLRTEAALADQVKELPGPAANQWLRWACNLQEEKDGFALSRLRKDFAAVDRFVAGMEESYWTPGKVIPESSSRSPEGGSRPAKWASSPPSAPVFATNTSQSKPPVSVRPQLDQAATRSGSNGDTLTMPYQTQSAEPASLTETLRSPEPATRWQAATAAVGNGASKLTPPRLNYCEHCGSSYRGEFHVCPVDSSVSREAAAATARDSKSREHAGDSAVSVAPARSSSVAEATVPTSEPTVDSSPEFAETEFERLKALVGDSFPAVEDEDELPPTFEQRLQALLADKRMLVIAAVAIIAFAGILAIVFHYAGKRSKPAPPPQTVSAKVPDVTPDSDIQKNIEQQMETLKGSSIQVAVQAGVVTLTGKTPSKADLVKAETLAAEVGGVKQVTNKIQVETTKGKGKR
jgi:hypothetical protein